VKGETRIDRVATSVGGPCNLPEVVTSGCSPDQVPAGSFEAAIADIDETVTGGERRARRDKGFDPDQQRVSTCGDAGFCHVVAGGDHVARTHAPDVAEKIGEIELGVLAAVTRIDPDEARRTPLDRGEQYLALTGRARDRGQAAQPGFRATGIAVRVNQPPMWFCSVDPLIDLLPDCGVETAIAFGEAADPEMTTTTGQSCRRDAREVELRGSAPADPAGDGWIVGSAEDAARLLPGKRPGRCRSPGRDIR
jgi:hypothetical protein